MQYNNQVKEQVIDETVLFSYPQKETKKIRKWREIEEFKARQKLLNELRDIDFSFNLSLKDLI